MKDSRDWLYYMHSLDVFQLRNLVSWLLGRSGISDEQFILKCKALYGEEEE